MSTAGVCGCVTRSECAHLLYGERAPICNSHIVKLLLPLGAPCVIVVCAAEASMQPLLTEELSIRHEEAWAAGMLTRDGIIDQLRLAVRGHPTVERSNGRLGFDAGQVHFHWFDSTPLTIWRAFG